MTTDVRSVVPLAIANDGADVRAKCFGYVDEGGVCARRGERENRIPNTVYTKALD